MNQLFQSKYEYNKVGKIKELWNKIHSDIVPSFHWQFHDDMFYLYNEKKDCIECDCGLSLPVFLKYEELNERNLRKLISEMEYQIYSDYKKMKWDIVYFKD